MNMVIYACELELGMHVLGSSIGQGVVKNTTTFRSLGPEETVDYLVVSLDAGRDRIQVGLLAPRETVEIEPVDDGLNAPITDIQ